MTPPKSFSTCPICFKTYSAMSGHLRRFHSVINLEERRLLLNLASRRVNICACPCPVAGCCYKFKYLDRHLQRAHPELSEDRRKMEKDTVRRRTTIQLLQALRATQPHPPMVSSLDIEPWESNEEVLEMRVDEPPQQTQYCESCQETAASIQHLVSELQKLRSKYRTLHKKYTRHMKSCRSVSIQEQSGEETSKVDEAQLSTPPSWSEPLDPSQPSSVPSLPDVPKTDTSVQVKVAFHIPQSIVVPADDQKLVLIKEEAPREQKVFVDQQNQKNLHIYEEEEELWTSLGEEQLNVKEETDATSFSFTAVHLKCEDDEDKPLLLELHQHPVDVTDLPTSSSADNLESTTGGESCGGTINPDLTPLEDDTPEIEVSHDDEEDNDMNNPDSQLRHLSDSGSETEDTDKDWESSPNRDPELVVKNNKNGQKQFWCELCGQSFSRKGTLNKHMRVHTGHKPFCCDLCGQMFTRKDSLNRHMRVHTGHKPFGCDLCERSFTEKGHLKSHMRVHTGQKPFCCELCDRRFTRKSSLNTHIRIHTGQKPFCCKVCDRRFIQKSVLTTHMGIHTGHNPFCCELCRKSFSRKGHLNIHMRIHTGQKPFCCGLCDRKFTTKSNLNTHTRIHTENKAVICNDS